MRIAESVVQMMSAIGIGGITFFIVLVPYCSMLLIRLMQKGIQALDIYIKKHKKY